jgi:predicted dienelactone hydrolase
VIRRVLKVLAVLALCVVAGVAILLASLWLDHTRSTTLPTPTGSYQVGRVTDVWTDDSRPNPFAPAPAGKEELAVWIWYPAAPGPSAGTTDYLPAYWRRALIQHQGFLLSKLLSRDLMRVHTHSWSDAEVSPTQPMYPVVILRAGGGALSTDYTSLAEDLASHGYVVVSFDAPYRTGITAFPDGRVAIRPPGANFEEMPHPAAEQFANQVMNAWIADIQFVLGKLQQLNASDATGRFKGKLNMQQVGIAGHSLGGATAAQFCHDDTRCKAGIDIDGMPFGSVIQDGMDKPFFFIMSDHSKESGPEGHKVEHDIASIYDKLPPGKRWQVTIVGANHFSFSDQMLTKSSILMAVLRRLGVLGLDKRRGLAITSTCVRTFFDVYLKGLPDGQLNSLPALYPELKAGIAKAFPRDAFD